MNQKMIVEVNQANFQADVIQRSYERPVVVDFWAPWCGPCRMLGPILERLAAESNGKFVLAKVNSDENPALSSQYNVRGIPNVKAFRNGQVVDEFVGAQPEPMVRQFIQRLTASVPDKAPASQARPVDTAARLNQAKQLLRQGRGCEAKTHLQKLSSSAEARQARLLLPLAQFLCDMGSGGGSRSDLDSLFQQAAEAIRRSEYSSAMYYLLAARRQDNDYRNGQATKVMVGLFELLGGDHELTQAYRQQLNELA